MTPTTCEQVRTGDLSDGTSGAHVRARDHLALEKDARDQRPVEPREQGEELCAMPS